MLRSMIMQYDTQLHEMMQASSPMEVLTILYAGCNPSIQGFLDNRVAEILEIDLEKIRLLSKLGPTMPAEDTQRLASMYAEAAKLMPNTSATVIDAGIELAEVIDKSVRRVLIGDKVANRSAFLSLVQAHARLVRCLADITLSPEDLKRVAEYEADMLRRECAASSVH